MRIIILFVILLKSLYAISTFKSNNICKKCHPIIYAEYTNSAHYKSSIFTDKLHKAIWDIHPHKTKKRYSCNKCHTPSDSKIAKALKNNTDATPKKDKMQLEEALSCVYCHSIKDIKTHQKRSDKNILVNNKIKRPTLFAANKQKRGEKIKYQEKTSFFGLSKSTIGSPYHDIDYSNTNFYTGKICMGCHAHFENKHNISICKMDYSGAQNEKQNCITCHMPKVKGSATTIAISKTHRFHGFAGLRNHQDMLQKYIKLDFKALENGFEIRIKNNAPHTLVIHTLRAVQLKVIVNNQPLKTISFAKVLGKNGKIDYPWLEDEILEDSMIKAHETRVVKYDRKIKHHDKIELVLGYYLINPKLHQKLKVQNIKEATQFRVLKRKFFIVQ